MSVQALEYRLNMPLMTDEWAQSLRPMYAGAGSVPYRPPEDFGIGGGGVARIIPGTGGLIERIRIDDHPPLGHHINIENIVPGSERKPIISNDHFKLRQLNKYEALAQYA